MAAQGHSRLYSSREKKKTLPITVIRSAQTNGNYFAVFLVIRQNKKTTFAVELQLSITFVMTYFLGFNSIKRFFEFTHKQLNQ